MSYTHTPVSASVIKSTSRFTAKAVPRKQATANVVPPRSTPAPIEEALSESEDEEIDEQQIDSLEDDAAERPVKSTQSASISRSSIPPIINSSNQTAAPISVPVPNTRSLRSTTAAIPCVEPTSTTATSSKRKQSASAKDENSRRLRRRTTPPTAEEVVISPSTMKMAEMCIDKRTGRKSSRYAELREAERQRRRLKELNKEQQQQNEATPAPAATEEVETAAQEEDDTLLPVTFGTARVVTDSEGNIVLDQSSLQVDRHAIHPSTMTDSLIQTTETMFTSKTNSSTYASSRSHASNTIRWLPSDNERFYEALRMFGTDFQTIADYLGGGKDRRHVKNKFYKEEKKNSDKLTWALKNKLTPDMARLAQNRGITLNVRDAESVREELAAINGGATTVTDRAVPLKTSLPSIS